MANKHTPGPWTVWQAKPEHSDTIGILAHPNGGLSSPLIAIINQTERKDFTRPLNPLADAQLIAAAPELLEALKRCVEYLGHNDCGQDGVIALEHGRAAIAKAQKG